MPYVVSQEHDHFSLGLTSEPLFSLASGIREMGHRIFARIGQKMSQEMRFCILNNYFIHERPSA